MADTCHTAEQRARSVAIVGGGIVGSCLARLLSVRGDAVTLIERGGDASGNDEIEDRLPGSTGLAPGFIGQLHTIDALRILAQRTVSHYKTVPDGFAAVGGMEVACSQSGLDDLQKRLALAEQTGVDARMLTSQEAVALEPRLLRSVERNDDGNGTSSHSNGNGVLGAVLYPDDGTADARIVARHEQEHARLHGATLLRADIQSVSPGQVMLTSKEILSFDDVVVCSGIWTRALLPRLAVHAVAHPYMYSREHERKDKDEQAATVGRTPFIRWPEYHVYARDHGPRFGMGSYSHPAVSAGDASRGTVPSSAKAPWQPDFSEVLYRAACLLPSATIKQFSLTGASAAGHDADEQPQDAFNGLFSVTPDGKPFAGLCESNSDGAKLYVCAAVWVTHAFGTAQWLANEMHGDVKDKEHAHIRSALDPHRYDAEDDSVSQTKALMTYNDIYIKEEASRA